MIWLTGLPLFCLCACWWWDVGELSVRQKFGLTSLYAASFGLLLLPKNPGFVLFVVAQLLICIIICAATFGLDWLMKQQ